MGTPERPDDVVTLVRLGDLTTAQLLRGRLDAEGIEGLLPDEHVATQGWHFHGAIGGIRVQVRRADLERAQEILADPAAPDLANLGFMQAEGESPGERPGSLGGGASAAGPAGASAAAARPGHAGTEDDGTISAGDRAAFRALRVTLVSLWLLGIVHPYSLWLAVRALGRNDLTTWGRRRAGIALVVSLLGCCFLATLVYRIARVPK